MANSYDVIIIGAGIDGLIAAATLGKEGKRVLLVEKREQVGGRAVTESFADGFRVSSLQHAHGGILPSLARTLELERHGLELLPEDRGVTTLRAGGPALHLPPDVAGAAAAIGKYSTHTADGEGYDKLRGFLERTVPFLTRLLTLAPLPFRRPSLGELFSPAWEAFKFRRLGEADMMELLRVGPMPLKDLTEDYIKDETVRATLAFPGLLGCSAGPFSPGSTATLLLWEASNAAGRLRRGGLPKGGLGAISAALQKAAQRYKVEVRTGAPVAQILRQGEVAAGVVLEDKTELRAKAVVSSLGATTFSTLFEAGAIGPTLRRRLGRFRTEGCVTKVHFALDGLPELPEGTPAGARLQVGSTLLELEKSHDDGKYGWPAEEPLLDVAFPSVLDPSLAPAGKHVASVWVQSTPYTLQKSNWDEQRDLVGDLVARRLNDLLPGFSDKITAREVLTPVDIEARFGLEGGHPWGGELALDQLFTNRPLPDCGTYQTPVQNLYLTGPGTHPGGHLTGAAGSNAARRILRDWKTVLQVAAPATANPS